MIDETTLNQTMRRMSGAFGHPKDLTATKDEFRLMLKQIKAQPDEAFNAVTRLIQRSETVYGFPTPAMLRNLIVAFRPPEPYEQDDTKEPGAFEEFKKAFEKTAGEPFPDTTALRAQEDTDGEVPD